MLEWLGKKLYSLFGESSTQGLEFYHSNQVNEMLKTYSFSEILPYALFNEEKSLFLNKNSIGFALEVYPMPGGATDRLVEDITNIVRDVIDEDSHLQCLLFADPRVSEKLENWSGKRILYHGSDSVYGMLAKKREEYLKKLSVSGGLISPKQFRCILSYTLPSNKEKGALELDMLDSTREKFIKLLSQHTIVKKVDAEKLLKFLDGMLGSYESDSLKEWNPLDNISNQVGNGSRLKIEEDRLVFGSDLNFKSFSVKSFPKMWTLSHMLNLIGDEKNDLIRMSFPFFINYVIYCPNQEKIESDFHKNIVFVEYQGKSNTLMRLIPSLEEEVGEYGFVRKKLHSGDRLLKTYMGMGVWAPKDEIITQCEKIKSIFRYSHIGIEENRYTNLHHYLGAMPMNFSSEWSKEFQEKGLKLKTSLSNEPGCFMPIIGEWQGTETPGLLTVGRRGQVAYWWPFDNDSGNYNVVVAGRSGSGKSVFMQELITSILGNKGRVFVIDVGRSFERSCKLLGGQFIEFSSKKDKKDSLCLNPFSKILLDDVNAQEDAFSMLKPVICLMAAPNDKVDDYKNALIERAIKAVWQEKGQKSTITDVSIWLESQEDDIAKKLGIMLTPYTKNGVYGKYFEGENNVNLENEFVVIELEELKERKDLQSVVLQMFIMSITNQMFLGDRKTAFAVCIDEAWDLLRGGQAGAFIETLARRLRKYKGSLVVGTQSINDFYQAPGALAAFENSDWMCLLSQKKESIEALKKSNRLSMDEAMESDLKSVSTHHGEYSEVMIYNAQYGYSIVRLVLDSFSEVLYSTQASDYSKVQSLVDSGISMEKAISLVAKERKK